MRSRQQASLQGQNCLTCLEQKWAQPFFLLPFWKSLDLEPANNVSFCPFCPRSTPAPSPWTTLQPSPCMPTRPPHHPLSIHTSIPQSCPVKPSCVSHTRGRNSLHPVFCRTPWWWTVSAGEKEPSYGTKHHPVTTPLAAQGAASAQRAPHFLYRTKASSVPCPCGALWTKRMVFPQNKIFLRSLW